MCIEAWIGERFIINTSMIRMDTQIGELAYARQVFDKSITEMQRLLQH